MSFKTVFIIVLGLAFLYGLFTIGSPFLLAIVIAIFLEPVNQLLIRYARMNRLAAATATCTLFILVVGGLGYLIGLKIFSQMIVFSKNLPSYMSEFNDFFQSASIKTKLFYEKLPDETAQHLQKGVDSAIESLNGIILGISGAFLDLAKGIPNLFIYFIVFLVALYLFSFSLNTIKASFLSLFEEKSKEKVENVLVNLRKAIFGFLRAQLIISGLTYIMVLMGCFILGLKYSFAVALLVIIVDILPILGTGSVLVPWAIVNFLLGDNFLGFGLLGMFLFITIFRRMIEPKILGDSVGIGALPALVSLYVGFKLVGVIGLFLGPIVVIIYYAMRKVGLLQFKIKLE